MSTPDVPGANPRHGDTLKTGCWAETANGDGSYILVEGFENGRVVYEVFDTSKSPPVGYRDAMPEARFKREFTWDPKDPKSTRWTWHDRTEFPWDAVIKRGVQSGSRPVLAQDILDQAADITDTMERLSGDADGDADDGPGASARRVARDLGLRGRALQAGDRGKMRRAFISIRDGFQGAIDELSV